MQYALPQFTDVEDKLIGPLTLKQFLFLLATGGLVFFIYSILGFSVFFFFFALPIAIAGISLTFGSFNGRPLFSYSGVFLSYVSKPQVRVFKREEPNVTVSFKAKAKNEVKAAVHEEPSQSRLKKLAMLLDQKTEEEKELITRS